MPECAGNTVRPMTELYGRLVNLDVAHGFTAVAPVLGSDPVGPLTGEHYPRSLVHGRTRPGIEPRIGISWRPIPASTVVVRAGYGIYHDTSVYLDSRAATGAAGAPVEEREAAKQSPRARSRLADGFHALRCRRLPRPSRIDPNFRVGYAQTWHLSVQRDLPFALQGTVDVSGREGHARRAGVSAQQLSAGR